MNTMNNTKCEVCNGTRCVYTGPIGDPPNECEACFDQSPATPGTGTTASAAGTIDTIKSEIAVMVSRVRHAENISELVEAGCEIGKLLDKALDARAEEARREADEAHHRALVKTEMEARNAGHREGYDAGLEQGTKDGLQMQMLRPDFDFAKFDLCASAQRTAGGDAVIGAPDFLHVFAEHCEREGYPSDDADTQAMLWKFFTYGMAAAQPVAEAAAQADDVPQRYSLRPYHAPIGEGVTEGYTEGRFMHPDPNGKWILYAAAAPTAQPTPPDDERAKSYVAEILPHHDRIILDGRYYGLERVRAALRQPGALPDEAAMGDLTDEQIILVWEGMPGGGNGYCKLWGYTQFARAIIDAARALAAKQAGKEADDATCEVSVAKNLTWLMKEAGVNAYALEAATGVPQPTIHRIMTGETADPRTATLKKLAGYLGVTVTMLRESDCTSAPSLVKPIDGQLTRAPVIVKKEA